MGWSCTMAADDSMRAVQETLPSKSNFWNDDKGQEFFLEIGREQESGAITGTVFDEKGYPKGGMRIEPNGYITRWPHLPEKARSEKKRLNAITNMDRSTIDDGVDKYLKEKGIDY